MIGPGHCAAGGLSPAAAQVELRAAKRGDALSVDPDTDDG